MKGGWENNKGFSNGKTEAEKGFFKKEFDFN